MSNGAGPPRWPLAVLIVVSVDPAKYRAERKRGQLPSVSFVAMPGESLGQRPESPATFFVAIGLSSVILPLPVAAPIDLRTALHP